MFVDYLCSWTVLRGRQRCGVPNCSLFRENRIITYYCKGSMFPVRLCLIEEVLYCTLGFRGDNRYARKVGPSWDVSTGKYLVHKDFPIVYSRNRETYLSKGKGFGIEKCPDVRSTPLPTSPLLWVPEWKYLLQTSCSPVLFHGLSRHPWPFQRNLKNSFFPTFSFSVYRRRINIWLWPSDLGT